jgi:hypothetical protein
MAGIINMQPANTANGITKKARTTMYFEIGFMPILLHGGKPDVRAVQQQCRC